MHLISRVEDQVKGQQFDVVTGFLKSRPVFRALLGTTTQVSPVDGHQAFNGVMTGTQYSDLIRRNLKL